MKKSDKIVVTLNAGELDPADGVSDLLKSAGRALDANDVSAVTGFPLFKTADGIWRVGATEFYIELPTARFLEDQLMSASECKACGHVFRDFDDYDEDLASELACPECGSSNLMLRISKARARQLVRVQKELTKPKSPPLYVATWVWNGEPTTFVSRTKDDLYKQIFEAICDSFADVVGHGADGFKTDEQNVDIYFEAAQSAELSERLYIEVETL